MAQSQFEITAILYRNLTPLTYVVSVPDPLDGVRPPGEALDPALQPRDLALAHQQPPRDLDKPEKRRKINKRQDKLYSETFSGIIIFEKIPP